MTLDAAIQVRRGGFELDASLRIEAGQTLSLAGPNGAGKSTIAAALSGEIEIDHGTITLGGRSLDDGAARTPAQARGIGVVFQDRLLFGRMSVRENIAFGVRAAGAGRALGVRGRSVGCVRVVAVGGWGTPCHSTVFDY